MESALCFCPPMPKLCPSMCPSFCPLSQQPLGRLTSYCTCDLIIYFPCRKLNIVLVSSLPVEFCNLIGREVSDHYLLNRLMDSLHICSAASSKGLSELVSISVYFHYAFCRSASSQRYNLDRMYLVYHFRSVLYKR